MAKKKVVCVGSTVVDVRGRPDQVTPAGSISPGVIYFGLGGIAYNMAESFTRLGCEAHLLSMLGTDIFGDFILAKIEEVGIRSESVERHANHPTARLVAMLNVEGEIQNGVFDGSIIEHISPFYLERYADLLKSADLIATNTVLPRQSLTFLSVMAHENAIPFYINGTSIALARRVLSVIDKSPILGVNREEAEELTGLTIESPSDALKAGKSLILAGAKAVIITLGPGGAVFCNSSSSYHCKALPATIVDTSGAGDALCSGFLSCMLVGHGIVYSLEYGLAVAALTVESEYVVSPFLSPSTVKSRMRGEAFFEEDARQKGSA